MGYINIIDYPDGKLQINQNLQSFSLNPVHVGVIKSIFSFIAGFLVKFSNAGRINPVTLGLAIFDIMSRTGH